MNKLGVFVTGLEVGWFGRELNLTCGGIWEVVVEFDGSHHNDIENGVITLLAADWLSVVQTPDIYSHRTHFLIEGYGVPIAKAKESILKYCYFRCHTCKDIIPPDKEQNCTECLRLLCPECFERQRGFCKNRSHNPYAYLCNI